MCQTETQILDEIGRRVAKQPDCLDMNSWHGDCGTTHCLAGHAQVIAGDMDKDPLDEGRRLIPSAERYFYAPTNFVRAWLACGRLGGIFLMDALRKLGVTVVVNETIALWSKGELYIFGDAHIDAVSGGEVWTSGSSAKINIARDFRKSK